MPNDPQRDGRAVTDEGGLEPFAPSGQPERLGRGGRADLPSAPEADAALREFSALAPRERISSLKVGGAPDGQSIDVPKEGEDDSANLKV